MTIIDNAVYVDGVRHAEPESLEQTFETLAHYGGMAWIGLYRPTREEMSAVAAEFGLHGLAVEDAVSAHQRPKLERYDDNLFTVLRPARYVDETETVEFGELHIFTGKNFVVTVRHAEMAGVARVRQRLEARPDLLGTGPKRCCTPCWTAWWMTTPRWWQAWKTTSTRLRTSCSAATATVSRRIYELAREVIQFQRAIHPLPDMMFQLKRGFAKYGVETELQHSLRDVEDHVERVISRADSFRDLLQNALTLDGTLTANRQNEASAEQNEQVKKISSWAAILFAPSFVAGIYGMNFDNMPELHWDLGYPLALALMVAIAAAMYGIFKKKGWL